MCAITTRSPTRSMALTVVPMPVSSECSKTVSASRRLAAIRAPSRATSASGADA